MIAMVVPPLDRIRLALAQQIASDARRLSGAAVEPMIVERWAQEAVASIWGSGPRIDLFVPVLALREVRGRIAEAGRAAAPEAAPASRPRPVRPRRDEDELWLDARDCLIADEEPVMDLGGSGGPPC